MIESRQTTEYSLINLIILFDWYDCLKVPRPEPLALELLFFLNIFFYLFILRYFAFSDGSDLSNIALLEEI
jgi:hypothetical protein